MLPDPSSICWAPQDGASPADHRAAVVAALADKTTWEALSAEQAITLFEDASVLQGLNPELALAQGLSDLYDRLADVAPVRARGELMFRLARRSIHLRCGPLLLVPGLMGDPDDGIVSSAAIDITMLGEADYDGWPEGFKLIEALYAKRYIRNPGAALGGLICLGDRRFNDVLDRWKPLLTPTAVRVAARCGTGCAYDGSVQFWLGWAEEIVASGRPTDESVFGSTASALALIAKRNRSGFVLDVLRHYPAQHAPRPVEELNRWTASSYASGIADRLYRLEAAEAAPKVFSFVLRAWGLPPRAMLSDQYVTDL